MILTPEQIMSLEIIKAAMQRDKKVLGDQTPVTDHDAVTYALDFTAMTVRFSEIVQH